MFLLLDPVTLNIAGQSTEDTGHEPLLTLRIEASLYKKLFDSPKLYKDYRVQRRGSELTLLARPRLVLLPNTQVQLHEGKGQVVLSVNKNTVSFSCSEEPAPESVEVFAFTDGDYRYPVLYAVLSKDVPYTAQSDLTSAVFFVSKPAALYTYVLQVSKLK